MKNIIYFFLLFFVYSSHAQITWDGGAGTNKWHHAANWDPNGVPTVNDDIEILTPGAKVVVAGGVNAYAASILIRFGGTLLVKKNGKLTVDGSGSSLNTAGITMINGVVDNKLVNEGTIISTNANFHGMDLYHGEFFNDGKIVITSYCQGFNGGCAGLVLQDDLSTLNDGKINITSTVNTGGTDGFSIGENSIFENQDGGVVNIKDISGASSDGITITGSVYNYGSINVQNVDGGVGILNTIDGFFRNRGPITISNVTTDGFVNRADGNFVGRGIITTNEFRNNALISPGHAYNYVTGIIDIYGNLSKEPFGDNSIYNVDIAGDDGPGEYEGHDLVNVYGNLSIPKTLNVTLHNNFDPDDLDEFTIFNYTNNLFGGFIFINLPSPEMDGWIVDYTLVGKVVLRKPPPSPYATNSPNLFSTSKENLSEKIEYTLYPNPTTAGNVVLKGQQIKEIKIYSSIGQLIKEFSFTNEQTEIELTTDAWIKGTYFIKINNGEILRLIVL